MKDYTTENPSFSDTISVVEECDLINAQNDTAATKQLLQNTLANKKLIEELENPKFKEAKTRENIESGNTLRVILGKIRKWFTDIGKHLEDKTIHITSNERVKWNKSTEVSVSQKLATGTKVGTITIDGTDYDLYCQTNTDTWTANSKGSAGYVPKGDGNANKYYGVDSNGNPEWREVDIAARVKSRGNLDASEVPDIVGLTMYQAYSNGYPISYGNILVLRGNNGSVSELLLGWSGSNKGIATIYYRNKRDVHDAFSEFRQIAFTTDNVASATRATQDDLGREISDTYAIKSEYVLKKKYTINLSSYANTNFYLITFAPTKFEIDCEIHSPSLIGTAAYNQNILHFLLYAQGWNDTPKKLTILNHSVYDSAEITIASIVTGNQNGTNGFYLRGGMNYEIYSNTPITLRTSQYTNENEVFPSGTPTCYKTGFTNVTIKIDFTTPENIGNFTKFDGELRAGSFVGNASSATKAAQDENGNNIANTYLKTSTFNNVHSTGIQASTLKELVEGIMGSNAAIRSRAGTVKFTANLVPSISMTADWKQFIATWQNHWNQNAYNIDLNVFIYESNDNFNTYNVYHVLLNGKNGTYNVAGCKKVIEIAPDRIFTLNKYAENPSVFRYPDGDGLQVENLYLWGNKNYSTNVLFGQNGQNKAQNIEIPFSFGIDSKGNYGYKKVGADTVTPFLSPINAVWNTTQKGSFLSSSSISGSVAFKFITLSDYNIIICPINNLYYVRVYDMPNNTTSNSYKKVAKIENENYPTTISKALHEFSERLSRFLGWYMYYVEKDVSVSRCYALEAGNSDTPAAGSKCSPFIITAYTAEKGAYLYTI